MPKVDELTDSSELVGSALNEMRDQLEARTERLATALRSRTKGLLNSAHDR
jgi:hypothetical protein